MNLTEALVASRPLLSCLQKAHTSLPGRGTVSVFCDEWGWGVLWLGSLFGFETSAEAEIFLEQEGVPLQDGWLPQISIGSVVQSESNTEQGTNHRIQPAAPPAGG